MATEAKFGNVVSWGTHASYHETKIQKRDQPNQIVASVDSLPPETSLPLNVLITLDSMLDSAPISVPSIRQHSDTMANPAINEVLGVVTGLMDGRAIISLVNRESKEALKLSCLSSDSPEADISLPFQLLPHPETHNIGALVSIKMGILDGFRQLVVTPSTHVVNHTPDSIDMEVEELFAEDSHT